MACSKKDFILATSVQLVQMYLLMDVLNPIETSTCTTYTWTFRKYNYREYRDVNVKKSFKYTQDINICICEA